jgi:hypothetical protein
VEADETEEASIELSSDEKSNNRGEDVDNGVMQDVDVGGLMSCVG